MSNRGDHFAFDYKVINRKRENTKEKQRGIARTEKHQVSEKKIMNYKLDSMKTRMEKDLLRIQHRHISNKGIHYC